MTNVTLPKNVYFFFRYSRNLIAMVPVGIAFKFCNNVDPKRDSILVQRPSHADSSITFACMGLDGTIKTKEELCQLLDSPRPQFDKDSYRILLKAIKLLQPIVLLI